MSIKQVMKNPDPKGRMFEMCGYLSALPPKSDIPVTEIKECIEIFEQWARSGASWEEDGNILPEKERD